MTSHFLRPPGVMSEQDLKARCISCGQCAAICRFDCVELTPDNLLGPDTPKIFPHKKPCFLCMRCVDTCPTNALRKVEMADSGMGVAKLDRKRCVDYQQENGVMCWTCYERCPLKASAIVLKYGYMPEITDKCVGCGVCEYVCPVKAIDTIPTRHGGKK